MDAHSLLSITGHKVRAHTDWLSRFSQLEQRIIPLREHLLKCKTPMRVILKIFFLISLDTRNQPAQESSLYISMLLAVHGAVSTKQSFGNPDPSAP